MIEKKHQWIYFCKGRMRVKACSNCGELNLPSNSESICSESELLNSQIVKAGYQKMSEIEQTIESAA